MSWTVVKGLLLLDSEPPPRIVHGVSARNLLQSSTRRSGRRGLASLARLPLGGQVRHGEVREGHRRQPPLPVVLVEAVLPAQGHAALEALEARLDVRPALRDAPHAPALQARFAVALGLGQAVHQARQLHRCACGACGARGLPRLLPERARSGPPRRAQPAPPPRPPPRASPRCRCRGAAGHGGNWGTWETKGGKDLDKAGQG